MLTIKNAAPTKTTENSGPLEQGRVTWLRPLSPDGKPLVDHVPCPLTRMPAALEGKDWTRYEGFLHTDHAVREEFFLDRDTPPTASRPYLMDFTYLYDDRQGDFEEFTHGKPFTSEEVYAEIARPEDWTHRVQDASRQRNAAAIKNLRDARPDADPNDVVTYGITPHPDDPGRRLLLLNFYLDQNLQTGKNIIDQALSGDTSKFIKNFQQVVFDPPDPTDRSAVTRYSRRVLCYRALLNKAGLKPPPDLCPVVTRLFNKDLLSAMTNSTSTTRAADHAQAAALIAGGNLSWDQIAQVCERLYDFMTDKSGDYNNFEAAYAAASTSGENWADDDLKKILEMFKYPNGSRQIGKVAPQHTPSTTGDYAEDIYNELVRGSLVIIDQSSGDEEINRANASRLMEYIFRENQDKFISGFEIPHSSRHKSMWLGDNPSSPELVKALPPAQLPVFDFLLRRLRQS